MSKRLCLFCSTPLGQTTSPEHILLDALGGRATTRRVICTTCNNWFGATIDKTLACQVQPIRTLLNLKSGTSKSPTDLSYSSANGRRHTLHPNGNVSTNAKPVTFTPGEDGAFSVSLNLSALEELNRFIPHIAAKVGVTEDEVRRQIEAGEAKRVTFAAPPFTANISLGGRDPLRSIVKACLVLCAARIDLLATQSRSFEAARAFVTKATDDFQNSRIVMEGRDIPKVERLTRDFGPIFNMIFCKSDDSGRMIAYYGLYNTVYWHITLAESGAPANNVLGVVSDPRAPNRWRHFNGDLFDIDTAWIKTPTLGTGDRITRSLEIALKQRGEDQRQDYLLNLIHETMIECGINYGERITPEFINRFSHYVALWWSRATFEQRLTPAQLRAALASTT